MNAITLVFVDGQFNESLSNHRDLPATVQFSYEDKIILQFAKGSKLLTPLYLKYINHGVDLALNIHVIADEQSDAILVEEYTYTQLKQYEINTNIQFHLHPHSCIRYYKLQNENPLSHHHADIVVEQKESSKINLFFADCGSLSANERVQINVREKHATCHMQGLYFLNNDNQSLNYKINVEHSAEMGVSSMLFKGILDKKSRALFHGKVHVQQNALHCKTEQANHNLLLSARAEVKTEPHLEIYADEVECKHGATIGQLDHEALFYLRSRGIDELQSLKILTRAFATDIIDKIEDLNIRKRFFERALPYAEF